MPTACCAALSRNAIAIGGLQQCTQLAGRFEKANKGFEGLAHARHRGREYLYALREANWRSSGPRRGRIDVFVRARGRWQASHHIALPKDARFEDYSALAIRIRTGNQ